ncbi:MAG: hypothetical protein KC635_02490 [Myxococcales bacterium]|nr:hypothetical protein [Myxococcales bacterium]MCB9734114.1 hypothetical protein [Deltaproteobacteria bacterium]
MSSDPQHSVDKRGRNAWIVIGGLFAIGTFLAVFVVFPNLKSSAMTIQTKIVSLDEAGKGMTAEECVKDVVGWYASCDAMPSMCLQEVPKAVAHCLKAKDRAAECAPYEKVEVADARWTFERCESIGYGKDTKDSDTRKACTASWRALEQFCKTHQKSVIWGVK